MPGSPPDLAPRPFPMRALGAGTVFLLLFGGIWFLVGSTISTAFTAGGGGVWNDVILNRRGVTVNATPVAVERTGASVNRARVYRVVYTFLDAHGTLQRAGSGTTDPELLAQARERRTLSVEYDPDNPARSRLTGEQASFFGWFVLFPMAFAIVGGVVLWRGLRRAFRIRDIYVHGTAAEAVVTGISPTSMRINGRFVMRVAYRFDALTGPASGSTTSTAPPPVGARLWILYRSANPNDNVAA